MEPAMFDGDRVLVKVHPLRYERGDVVVLDSPQNGRIAKRLVAFGGEMVEIRDNKVFVNGVSLGADRFAGLQYYSDSTTWFAHENVPYRVPAGSSSSSEITRITATIVEISALSPSTSFSGWTTKSFGRSLD